MVDPRDEPIELSPSRYAEWRDQFEAERGRIRRAISSRDLDRVVERIEHVGSTAVPDIAAKDVIDVDIVVEDDAVRPVSHAIVAKLGGTRFENADSWQPVFRRQDDQRFNDHVFATSSDRWKVSVVTREVLRVRPTLRAEYEQLKRELADQYDDLGHYSAGKSEFFDRVLREAQRADGLTFDFAVPQ